MAQQMGVVLVIVWELDDKGKHIERVFGPEWISARCDEDATVLMARRFPQLPPEKMKIQTAWVFRNDY